MSTSSRLLERASDFVWRNARLLDRQRFAFLFLGAPAAPVIAAKLVELDPGATGYVRKPVDWAPTPESWCRRLFDDQVLSTSLDALAAGQQSDGGWTISWPPVSPLVELEWRGAITINVLKTLHAYGRA